MQLPPIAATTIGSFPRPRWLADAVRSTVTFNLDGELLLEGLDDATTLAIRGQELAGLDLVSDGEQRRPHFIDHILNSFEGVDTVNRVPKGLYRRREEVHQVPRVHGAIARRTPAVVEDLQFAKSRTDRPVKITVPGPTTIMDTCANTYYDDPKALATDLAEALNFEVRALAAAGCKNIQIDEPLFARNVNRALEFGIECVERCFDGVPDDVTRVMHMCCGYPDHLDDEEYHKADPMAYFRLAGAVDRSSVHQVSIEDAHRNNRLALLEEFRASTVVLGAVAIARSRIEPEAEIAARLSSALRHIDRGRLMVAPDCGLAMLGRNLAIAKLKAMCAAAKSV